MNGGTMKKTGKTAYLLGAVLILFALVFVSCDQGGPGSDMTPPSVDDPSTDPPPGKTALAMPGNFQVSSETFLLTWGAVPNAASYSVQIGNATVTVTEPKYQLAKELADDPAFPIFVTAVPAGGSASYTNSTSGGFVCEPARYVFTYDTPAAARALIRAGETFAITGLTVFGKTLPNIVIPEKIGETIVAAIGAGAFEGGIFESVTIAANVKSVGENAFKDCAELVTIAFAAPSDTSAEAEPPALDPDAFTGCPELSEIVVIVPPGGDSSYADKIQDNLPEAIVDQVGEVKIEEPVNPDLATVTITGLGAFNGEEAVLAIYPVGDMLNSIAMAELLVSNGSATFELKTSDEELPWTGRGYYMLYLVVPNSRDAANHYVYTNGAPLDSGNPMGLQYNITDENTIEFNKFKSLGTGKPPVPQYDITIELDPINDRVFAEVNGNTITVDSDYRLAAWYLNGALQTAPSGNEIAIAGMVPDTYLVKVIAFDSDNVPWSNDFTVTVTVLETPEHEVSIVLVDPFAETYFAITDGGSTITIKPGFTVQDWFVDGVRQGTPFDPDALPAGTYRVKLFAIEDETEIVWSNELEITVTVPETPQHEVTIELSPITDTEFVSITANTITVDSDYTLKAWYLDGTLQQTLSGNTITLPDGLSSGEHLVKVVALDGSSIPWSNDLIINVE
jgi:hypothetical protein